MSAYPPVKTVEEFRQQPEEYQTAVRKIVRSHALNELYGAQVFDEPAIELAPTPYAKWLTCRVAMEEYHHHVRFKELADQIGVRAEEMDTRNKRPLNIFELPLESWEQFCVIKMLGDLAEILQVEDLLHCSFVPLRNIARTTMPEEKFHAQFGLDFCVDLVEIGRRPRAGAARGERLLSGSAEVLRRERLEEQRDLPPATASSCARTRTCAPTTWRARRARSSRSASRCPKCA